MRSPCWISGVSSFWKELKITQGVTKYREIRESTLP